MAANAAGSAPARAEAIETPRGLTRSLIALMRPHQWVKNLFVLTPILFSRRMGDPAAVAQALLATVAFCLVASALYIVNDIIDAPADRLHPEKRRRPIASGALRPSAAAIAGAILFFCAMAAAANLSSSFLTLIGLYFVSTLSYSLWFKRTPIVDCILIAAGFVLRVAGGAAAIGVTASHWLIVCAFLLACYLAFAKRRQELLTLADGAIQHRRVLGEYTIAYVEQVNNILLAAVLVCYALYTVSPETIRNFGTDRLIYGTVFVLYGLLRYMALSQNTAANAGDAGKLLLKDRPLQAAIGAWATYNALVIYWAHLFG